MASSKPRAGDGIMLLCTRVPEARIREKEARRFARLYERTDAVIKRSQSHFLAAVSGNSRRIHIRASKLW
jgi:hypothetical protein